MTYKIIFFALVFFLLTIFGAAFGNLLSLLPISLTDISDFLAQAASIISAFLAFGNLFFVDDFIFQLFYIFCYVTFFFGNFYFVYRIIGLFR